VFQILKYWRECKERADLPDSVVNGGYVFLVIFHCAYFNALMVKSNTSLVVVNSPFVLIRLTGVKLGDHTVNVPPIHPLASVGLEHFSLLMNFYKPLPYTARQLGCSNKYAEHFSVCFKSSYSVVGYLIRQYGTLLTLLTQCKGSIVLDNRKVTGLIPNVVTLNFTHKPNC